MSAEKEHAEEARKLRAEVEQLREELALTEQLADVKNKELNDAIHEWHVASLEVADLRTQLGAMREALQEAHDLLRSRAERAEKERDRMKEALGQLLGVGHNLKAFAGTMLRWNEPGIDFSDEARRIVELAEKNHTLICAALSKVKP